MQLGIAPCGVIGSTELFYQTYLIPVTETLFYASAPLVTADSDNPPSTYIRSGFEAPVISRALSRASPGHFDGLMIRGVADLQIANGDGELDHLVGHYVVRDRPVRIHSGYSSRVVSGREIMPSLEDFSLMFKGRAVDLRLDGDRVVLRVEDQMRNLDRPAQQQIYEGHGGRNGDAAIAGQRVPLCFGNCFNISPTLVDSLRGIYQVNEGEVKNILTVRDRGSSLEISQDVRNYGALEALKTQGEVAEEEPFDIGLGQVVTCRREGFFRLGGLPIGRVTADVEGSGTNSGAVPFDRGVFWDRGVGFSELGSERHRRYIAGILFKVLTEQCGFAEIDFDVNQVIQFDLENPFDVSMFVGSDSQITAREFCSLLLQSVGAVMIENRFGQIALRPLIGPQAGTNIEINATNIGSDGPDVLPLPYAAAWSRVRMRFGVNWTPMTNDEIAADVSATMRAKLLSSGSYREHRNSGLAVLYPDQPPLQIESVLVFAHDADTVCQRTLSYYEHARLYRVNLLGRAGRLDLMDTVRLTHPRYGLGLGKLLEVVDLTERTGAFQTDLQLFG